MNPSESRILDDLNPPQREAVETLEGPLLILAGAGSGKTRVVTRRIANFIAHGVRPWQILAITFTNKAAAEMRHRVEALAGEPGVWLSTFHSFCARLLRREGEHLGFHKDFTIYDEDDALSILKDITKRLGLSEDKRYSPRNVRQIISNLKGKALKSGDLDESLFQERIIKQIFSEYEAELKKNQALDFDDLLRQAVFLFREHPAVLERYQDRFRYILVDEYQDTNSCQYNLIKQLGQKHRNVCATGDPDQSIYGWRGADVRNILAFEKDFPETKVVKLEQNYRSTQRILHAAGAVIDNNLERKKKSLWTENPEGELITLTVTGDEQLEAFEVAKQIERHVREGQRYNDLAVFYRTNAQSRAIETALIQSAIPYQLVGGTAFYDRKEVKDALSYLRLVVNPQDDVAFRRILNVPKRGLGDSALELIEQRAAKTGQTLFETLNGPEGEKFVNSFKPKPRQGLIQFARLIDELRAMPSFPVENLMAAMLDRSGMQDGLLESGELERIENLNELINAAAEFDKDNTPDLVGTGGSGIPDGPPPEPGAFDGLDELAQRQASVSGFLENSALLAPTDKFNPEQDRVTLMTLHMAKGLEFDVVFLTGVEEGLLPLVRVNSASANALSGGGEPSRGMNAGEDEAAIEEERRLVYVGMTRARKKLYLSRTLFRRRFGKSDTALPSRFLDEIPEKLLETEDRSQPAWAQNSATAKAPRLSPHSDGSFVTFEREMSSDVFGDEQQVQPSNRIPQRHHDPALRTLVDKLLDNSDTQDAGPEFNIGDRVRHAHFGDGTVETISGSGLSAKVKVHFRSCGPKLLLLNLAKLQKM